jgi:NADP-dependent 3-hydroxy acid dehydrogenase YdfG
MVETELGQQMANDGMRRGLEQPRTSIESLQAEDIAAAALYAVTQPPRVNVNEILLRPTGQER